MRNFLDLVILIIIYGIYIAMACVPQWSHKYLGTVSSKTIIQKKELKENTGHYLVCDFEYKDAYGNVRPSSVIDGGRGFKTHEGTWVSKQLLEKGKVYVPGWKTGYTVIFVFLSIFMAFETLFTILKIVCVLSNERSYHECNNNKCPVLICPFKIRTKEPEQNKQCIKIKHFFGYK